eukprot:scaffold21632_cov62-Phaeocystis_antarctica.AAC.5
MAQPCAWRVSPRRLGLWAVAPSGRETFDMLAPRPPGAIALSSRDGLVDTCRRDGSARHCQLSLVIDGSEAHAAREAVGSTSAFRHRRVRHREEGRGSGAAVVKGEGACRRGVRALTRDGNHSGVRSSAMGDEVAIAP